MLDHVSIPCIVMRGGTSKGPYFRAEDLPADKAERDRTLLRVMGSPDLRQIDGLGGADTLTSKVAIVSKSKREGVDVDYLALTDPGLGDPPVAGEARLLVAARVGSTRLIDNIEIHLGGR